MVCPMVSSLVCNVSHPGPMRLCDIDYLLSEGKAGGGRGGLYSFNRRFSRSGAVPPAGPSVPGQRFVLKGHRMNLQLAAMLFIQG